MIEMPSKGLDDLFTTQAEREDTGQEKVRIVPFELIDDYPDHPFRVRMDEEMKAMIESVKEHGVLVPALLRPKPGGRYEMVAGHRRKFAGEVASLPGLPSVVREMGDDAATIVMVDSNLQREKILPSEKAHAYKMKMDALKKQGARTDLTSDQVGPKLRSNETIAIENADSISQVKRFIRLTELIPQILEMVDDEQIKFNPAVELSYLTKENQETLYEIMEAEQCKPSHAQAIRMKDIEQAGGLAKDSIISIMHEEKGNQAEQIKIPKKSIEHFFAAGTKAKEIQATIVKALELYHSHEKGQRAHEQERERER
jgi:ParB family chromosome partitioning protein